MGYTLKIGQAISYRDPQTGTERFDCEKVFLEDAPAFGEITDHTNTRMPSYATWEEFAHSVGLYEFFYGGESGLLNGPEGVSILTMAHKRAIDKACAAYVEKHPSVFSVKEEGSFGQEDFHFERLRWLKFWTDWALENCSNPIFFNEQ